MAIPQEDRLSFDNVLKSFPVVRQGIGDLNTMGRLLQSLPGYLLGEQQLILAKPDEQLVSRQSPAKRAARDPGDDRVFPLASVELEQFRLKHHKDIDEATIHTGPYANELARSLNALAVTIGTDIYFRDRAYNRGSEEGRETAAHELMHVAQYKEGKLSGNASIEELEKEARQAEGVEKYEEDPFVVLNVSGKSFRFRRSKMKYYAHKLSGKIEEWVNERKFILDEKEYLRLLIRYKKWKEEAL
jgi:hypothetical protein